MTAGPVWTFRAADDVGPTPPDGALVEVIEEMPEEWTGSWVIAWDGRQWLAHWHELEPAAREGET